MSDYDRTKSGIRARLRAARRGLCAEVGHRLSIIAARRIVDLREFRAARHLVLYQPTDGEISPTGFDGRWCAKAGRSHYYPVLGRDGLEFRSVGPGFRRGWGGIPEPGGTGRPPADGGDTLVIVPGVAFAATGCRVGRGGGHYDRALYPLTRAVRVGLAFELQIMDSLPSDPWDVAMHYVVTEARVLCASHPRLA